MRSKYFIIILIFFLTILLSLSQVNAAPTETQEMNIDLNNDGLLDKIIVLPNNIQFYRYDKKREFSLVHEFKYDKTRFSSFNQYNVINQLSETIYGQDVSSAFALENQPNYTRYNVANSIFSKNKFIIADVNGDNLLDFVMIKEPNIENSGYYQHLIYYQGTNVTFPDKPSKILEERRSSWITGYYYDINNDGFPEKIEIRYKHRGALLSDTKCIINIYFADSTKNRYRDVPDVRIYSSGVFYAESNFIDINKDGFPDILIVDMPKKPKSIEEAITKMLDKDTEVVLKFYLYKKDAKNYSAAPSFIKKINVNFLQDLSISLNNDFNYDGYKDLLVTQPNHSEKYLFDPEKGQFKETNYK